MAVPKKKTSVSRKGLRRAGHTHKLQRRFTIACPNCGAAVVPLHICPSCGTYKGKEYIQLKADTEEESGDQA
ncbi:MAG: 50S ribosomal protein L32 [Bacteriovoracaceae bacterium]|nr:50S ribosomal protein L32 [Bacteriovoracaceae bacterium]